MQYDDDFDQPEEEQPRDPAIDQAAERLGAFFNSSSDRLFYSTQIETTLEREFFHWITGKALLELAEAGELQKAPAAVESQIVNFYAHRKHRYIKREQSGMVDLLERIFDPEFAHAIGRHGELMFDAALGRHGFQTQAMNTNAWNGKTWGLTNHNLDRIVTKDGLTYGVEIKNTQNYISYEELHTKIKLCKHLGVIPLFIMRFAPKSYMFDIYKAGGFGLLFEQQLYPWGHSELLGAVRQTLGLKVQCPRDIQEGDIRRLLNNHAKRLAKP